MTTEETSGKYFLRDMETFELVEVTKTQYDNYHKAIEFFRPKIDGAKGRVQIFGTLSDNEGGYDYKDLFKQDKK